MNEPTEDALFEIRIREAIYDVVRRRFPVSANLQCFRISIVADEMGRHIEANLEAFMLGKIDPEVMATVEVPADWWQALKERWFPRWALRRWPARRRSIATRTSVIRVCPHLPIDGWPTDRVHHAFLDDRADRRALSDEIGRLRRRVADLEPHAPPWLQAR